MGRTRLRRWGWRAGVAVVLGAVTTVGVAWGLAFRSVPGAPMKGACGLPWTEQRPARADGLKINGVRVSAYRTWGAMVFDATASYGRSGEAGDDGARGVIPSYMRGIVLAWEKDGALDEEFRFVNARGWPWPALYAVRSGKFVTGGTMRGGWRLTSKYEWRYGSPSGYIELVTLPYRPVWVGVAADSAVFAGMWIGVLYGVKALRARLRRGAGRCLKCGYDLSGTPAGMACPECGAGARGEARCADVRVG